MGLPRKSRPIFSTTLPISGEKIDFHPMRREDEKILLMAKSSAQKAPQGEAILEILPAIKHTVEACITPETKARMKPMTLVDMEWLFIQIRMMSVDSKVTVTYHDGDDEKDFSFEIPLNEVKVNKPDVKPHIDLGDGLVLQMRYPLASLYEDAAFLRLEGEDQLDAMIVACMDKVFENDSMTPVDSVPKEEAIGFINDMDRVTFNKVVEFLDTLPSLEYKISYKNTNGKDREIILNTLTDFFTFV